jgi:hypothetical protein
MWLRARPRTSRRQSVRCQRSSEIAEAVLDLASDASAFTGGELIIDGGMSTL